MDILRRKGVIFGFSATVTRENNELVVSDEFLDHYIEKGCFLGWYFNYIPIGREPNLDLMPTPEQRMYRVERLNRIRNSKDIILADFWNDGALTGGCIAGGREYFHVTYSGDVEPCVFCHFAVDNVREKSLVEIINSPFFNTIRSHQPFNENLLCPCMLIDNPEVIRLVVKETGAHPTHEGAESLISTYSEFLDAYSQEYRQLSRRIWERDYCTEGTGEPSHSS
jgi:MoaA/NifB/PqqE/SkfB family radical SAM enzyme